MLILLLVIHMIHFNIQVAGLAGGLNIYISIYAPRSKPVL